MSVDYVTPEQRQARVQWVAESYKAQLRQIAAQFKRRPQLSSFQVPISAALARGEMHRQAELAGVRVQAVEEYLARQDGA